MHLSEIMLVHFHFCLPCYTSKNSPVQSLGHIQLFLWIIICIGYILLWYACKIYFDIHEVCVTLVYYSLYVVYLFLYLSRYDGFVMLLICMSVYSLCVRYFAKNNSK